MSLRKIYIKGRPAVAEKKVAEPVAPAQAPSSDIDRDEDVVAAWRVPPPLSSLRVNATAIDRADAFAAAAARFGCAATDARMQALQPLRTFPIDSSSSFTVTVRRAELLHRVDTRQDEIGVLVSVDGRVASARTLVEMVQTSSGNREESIRDAVQALAPILLPSLEEVLRVKLFRAISEHLQGRGGRFL